DNYVGWGQLNAFYASTLVGKPYYNQKMEVNNKQWRDIFSTMKDLDEKRVFPKTVPPDERPEGVPEKYFLAGRLAMTFMQYGDVVELISLNEDPNQLEGFEPFAWDVVTMPVHPEAPDVSPSTTY